MPRIPYDQLLAEKAARRASETGRNAESTRGSQVGSDASSLFSAVPPSLRSHRSNYSDTSYASSQPYDPAHRSPYPYPKPRQGPHHGTYEYSSTSRGSFSSYAPSLSYYSPERAGAAAGEGRTGRSPSPSPSSPLARRAEPESELEYFPNSQSSLGLGLGLSSSSLVQAQAQAPDPLQLQLQHGPREYLAPPHIKRSRSRSHKSDDRSRAKRGRRKYDSPLRLWARYTEYVGHPLRGLGAGLVLVGLVKVLLVLALSTLVGEEGWLSPIKWTRVELGDGGGEQAGTGTERKSDDAQGRDWEWGWRAIIVQVVWWGMVCGYVGREAMKGGRSWRTRMTGILTILSAPTFMLASTNSTLLSTSALGSLILLSVSVVHDHAALALFTLVVLLVPGAEVAVLAYLPALLGYVLGKAVWLRGGIKGATYFLSTISTLIALAIVPTMCNEQTRRDIQRYIDVDRLALSHPKMAALCRSLGGHSFPLELAARYVHSRFRLLTGSVAVRHVCAVQAARVRRDTTDNLAALGRFLFAFIPIMIMISSSVALRPARSRSPTNSANSVNEPNMLGRPSPSPSPSPLISLLPLALFISSIPPFIFPALANDTISPVLPLLPVSLLMALRSTDSVSGGQEVWRVGAWLHVIGTMRAVPLSSTDAELALSTFLTGTWTALVGFSPRPLVPMIASRQIIHLFLPRQVMPYAIVVEDMVVRAIFGLAWGWGVKMLLRAVWAMGGLDFGTGNGSTGKAEPKVNLNDDEKDNEGKKTGNRGQAGEARLKKE